MPLRRSVPVYLLAFAMIAVGVQHFRAPEPFVRIVPDWLPAPLLLVHVSGFFEILGGLGLLLPKTRRAAGWGLVALFVAVFPANIHMAIHEIQLEPGGELPVWAMWARLPLQAVFIAWAWWCTRRDRDAPFDASPSKLSADRGSAGAPASSRKDR